MIVYCSPIIFKIQLVKKRDFIHKLVIIVFSLILGFITFQIPVVSEWIQNSVFWLIIIILLSYLYKNNNSDKKDKIAD
ncbi:hypothetical protein MQW34_12590 [Bacillus sp. ZJS3]|nr:hypothetical protein MQW34_12590 [Bacillus sp. ZJS3]